MGGVEAFLMIVLVGIRMLCHGREGWPGHGLFGLVMLLLDRVGKREEGVDRELCMSEWLYDDGHGGDKFVYRSSGRMQSCYGIRTRLEMGG